MGKKIKKIVVTTGIVSMLLFGMAGCSKGKTVPTSAPIQTEATTEADLNIRVNVPITEVDMGEGVQQAEVLETYEDNTYTGKLENGDTYTTLNVPKLSTNHNFTEEEAMMIEMVIEIWKAESDKSESGLIELIKDLIPSFSEQEYNEIVDFILAQYPIPVHEPESSLAEAKPEQSKVEAKPEQSKANNNSNTTEVPQPTQPAPTPAPQQTESVYEDPEISAEEQAEWEEFQKKVEERGRKQAEAGYIDHSDAGPNAAGYDGSGEINIGNGM